MPSPTNSPAASAETWSPEVAPGGKPDLHKILEEAKQLTSAGLYEEALQRYLWFHNHEQEFGDPYRMWSAYFRAFRLGGIKPALSEGKTGID